MNLVWKWIQICTFSRIFEKTHCFWNSEELSNFINKNRSDKRNCQLARPRCLFSFYYVLCIECFWVMWGLVGSYVIINFNAYLPVIGCLRSGKLLNDVTLLLSIDKSTGIGAVVPSECDLSWTARVGKHAIALLFAQAVVGWLPNP